MKIKLTAKELTKIRELAHRYFVENNPQNPGVFYCECYVKAIVSFCIANDYNVVDLLEIES